MLIRSEEEGLQPSPRDEPSEKEDWDPAERSPRGDLSLRSFVEIYICFVLDVAEDCGDGDDGKGGDRDRLAASEISLSSRGRT